MVRKYYLKFCAVLITAIVLFPTGVLASATYGFGSAAKGCSLWTMAFPISFQIPDNEPVSYPYNIIWIDDDSVMGMMKYPDFYITPYNQKAWPSDITDGTEEAWCTMTNACVAPVNDYSVGNGISAYDAIKQEFPSATVNVATGMANGSGDLYWEYLPARKLKLLRIEVFAGITHTPGFNFSEPIYFEYRSTGHGSELKLEKWGSMQSDTSNIHLPDTFDLTLTLDIQVWFERRDGKLLPKAHIDPLSTAQIERVPASCK